MLFDLMRGNLTFGGVIAQVLVILLMIFLVLPVHEFAHAGVAYLMGDKAIRRRGRLTLNPLYHIDIMGALCMLLLGFGWAKAVPIDPRNFKNPKVGMAITALAGPVSNVLCGMLGGVILAGLVRFSPEFLVFSTIGKYVYIFLLYYVQINATLAVFNMIPIPPLDGSKVLFMFLPDSAVQFCYRYQQYSFILIYALLLTNVLDGVIGAGSSFIFDLCTFFVFRGI